MSYCLLPSGLAQTKVFQGCLDLRLFSLHSYDQSEAQVSLEIVTGLPSASQVHSSWKYGMQTSHNASVLQKIA